MSIFQILILLFIVFVIYKAVQRLVKKEISGWLFSVWLIFWLILGAIASWPISISWLANFLGIGRGVDLVIYAALFIIFYVVFKINLRLGKLEKNLSQMARRAALEEAKKKTD